MPTIRYVFPTSKYPIEMTIPMRAAQARYGAMEKKGGGTQVRRPLDFFLRLKVFRPTKNNNRS